MVVEDLKLLVYASERSLVHGNPAPAPGAAAPVFGRPDSPAAGPTIDAGLMPIR